jgi:penicillin amidase
MRLVGMPRIAHRLVDVMTDEERTACERFAAGVNHFIDTAGLPVEFRALRYTPALWEPADSMAVFRLLAWSISGSLDVDATAEQVRNTIGEEWANAMYQGGVVDQPPMIREHQRTTGQSPVSATRLPIFPQFGASNAWAVSAERSITGGALLANDPHLELRNPSIWCEARIEAPGFRVAGATVPGVPAIIIGRTPTLAWGVTAGMTPQMFLYRETIGDGRVELGDQSQPLRTHDEFIAVKGQQDDLLRIRHTPRGPLISDLRPQPDGQHVSLHWTGMEEGHELSALLNAARATDIDEVLPLFRRFATPPVNAVVADAQNNIAAVSLGRVALRTAPPGLLSPEEFPPSYIDPDELPLERNPERGWVACANCRVVGDDHSHDIYGNWAPGFRYRRIADQLESRPRHSPNGFRNLQLDSYSLHAAEMTPCFVALLEDSVDSWVVDELKGWDYEMTVESRAALLFEAIHREWKRWLRHC